MSIFDRRSEIRLCERKNNKSNDLDSTLWLGVLWGYFAAEVVGDVFYEGIAVSTDIGLELGALLKFAVCAAACSAIVAGAEGVVLFEVYGGVGAVGVEELYGGDALGSSRVDGVAYAADLGELSVAFGV